RVGDLEANTGGANINLQRPGRTMTPPPYAGLSVSAGSGKFVLQITNPEFKTASGKLGNTRQTPIYHHIDFSDTPQFNRGVVSLPATTQTYLEVGQFGSATKYVRLQSSHDGKTKNSPQFSGPHKS